MDYLKTVRELWWDTIREGWIIPSWIVGMYAMGAVEYDWGLIVCVLIVFSVGLTFTAYRSPDLTVRDAVLEVLGKGVFMFVCAAIYSAPIWLPVFFIIINLIY